MAIVVTHIARDLDTLRRQVETQPPMADLVELRLDHVGNPGEDELRALLAACEKRTIVTLRGPEAFGFFEGSADERFECLHAAARAGATFVDVDWTESLDLGEMDGKCHRIVSRHETGGTPEDLAAMHEEVREVLYEGDVTKLVTHANTAEDGLRMLRYLREAGGGLIAFCSGEVGAFTRPLAPIFGSPFIYAAPARLPGRPAPEPGAPGQMPVNDLVAMLPPGGLSPETAIFAILGNPARHSFSPRIQGMALKAARLDAVFVPIELSSFDGLADLVGDENFRGFSVTAPFKGDAFALASEHDEASKKTSACNTLVRTRTGWRGANTDVPAIAETLERAFRVHGEKPGRPVALGAATTLVLGAGGAARAAVEAVLGAGGRATIAARSLEKAQALASELGCEAVAWDALGELAYDVLVNCTPVGSLADPGRSPIPEESIRPGTLVLDAVYRPIRTPLLAAAHRKGCTAVPGGEWFVRQAEAQFRLFTQLDPDTALMRAAFETVLAEDPR